jgi:hypothetical protein
MCYFLLESSSVVYVWCFILLLKLDNSRKLLAKKNDLSSLFLVSWLTFRDVLVIRQYKYKTKNNTTHKHYQNNYLFYRNLEWIREHWGRYTKRKDMTVYYYKHGIFTHFVEPAIILQHLKYIWYVCPSL